MSWLAALESEESARIARAVRHLMHRELSLGWVSWHAQWQEVVRKRSSASRGLLHLMHGKLSAGWNSWVEMAAEQRKAQEVRASARRGLLHMINGKVSAGWLSWAAMAAEQREAIDRQAAHTQRAAAPGEPQGGVWLVLVGWRWPSERRKAMELIQRCVSFLKPRKLSAGWTSWLASSGGAAEGRGSSHETRAAGLLHLDARAS